MAEATDLHLICFDNPCPPDYGGAIDMYYKVRALRAAGLHVTGHVFHYGRPLLPELNDLFSTVHVYGRSRSALTFLTDTRPFIVSTRSPKNLFNRVLKDSAPVLCEGLHGTAFLPAWKQAGKQVFVRTHNVEHSYYHALAAREPSLLKRFYYSLESKRLRKYEKTLKHADGLACIAQTELPHFQNLNPRTDWVPPFHGFNFFKQQNENKGFALLQGNFGVNENVEALNFFIDIFKESGVNLCVAGKNPPTFATEMAAQSSWLQVIGNPSESEMQQLTRDSAFLVLYSRQQTGIKLKLLSALYSGKPVISNPEMVAQTGLENGVHLCNSRAEWLHTIRNFAAHLPATDLMERDRILSAYQPEQSAKALINLIFGD